MDASTIPALTLAAPTSLPTAGIGGSYYDEAFGVPTYPSAMNDMVTWRMLDNWNHININYALTEGIAVGLVWATLVYLLALTPNRKRTTHFHTFMLVGLIFMLIHLMIDAVSYVTPGLQPTSAYIVVTGDVMSSTWNETYTATFVATEITGRIAFIFAAICLWLQAKALMTGVRVTCPTAYRIILAYLIVAALAAFAIGMAKSIQQIMLIGRMLTPAEYNGGYQLRIAEMAAYTISVGSFALVSITSVLEILWKRPASVITGHSAYASALNLVGLLGAQSFVIPFIFCVLQIIPNSSVIIHPEIMLLPSVYLVLPLGSLFMTVNSSDPETQKASFPPKSTAKPFGDSLDRSPTLTTENLTDSRASSYNLDGQGGERDRTQTDSEIKISGPHDSVISDASETDAMLKSKAEKGKKESGLVTSEKMTV